MLGVSKHKQPKIIGVSGTFGKTTVVQTISHILRSSGFSVAHISSFSYCVDSQHEDNNVSANTVNKSVFKEFMNKAKSKNVDFIIVEITSKNFFNGVYNGIMFDIGILTNIFLPNKYYSGWDQYAENALNVVKKIKPEGLLIANGEEQAKVLWLLEKSNDINHNIYTYWVNPFSLESFEGSIKGTSLTYESVEYRSNLLGEVNLSNLYFAIRACLEYMSPEKIASALGSINLVKGNLEVLNFNPLVIIDSSYHPESILRVVKNLENYKQPTSKLISILGLSGHLPQESIKDFGEIIKLNDVSIFSALDPIYNNVSDINSRLQQEGEKFNSRLIERISSTDEYEMINKDNMRRRIAGVLSNSDKTMIAMDAQDYTSRLDAITLAFELANPEDIIFIPGKGITKTLNFGDVEYEWFEEEAVKIAFQGPSSNVMNNSTSIDIA